MDFRIADTFTGALARLPAAEQKATKVSVLDLQLDPSTPGLQLERISKSKDPNYWSARVGRDLRLILHKTASNMLIAYVDHHDAAYAWAERRRIAPHPVTGAMQIVVLPEFVLDPPPLKPRLQSEDQREPTRARRPFSRLNRDEFLSVGTPADWIDRLTTATEQQFLDWSDFLPPEAADLLFQYCTDGRLTAAVTVVAEKAFDAPAAKEQFRLAPTVADLEHVLNSPWRWDSRLWRRRFVKYLTSPTRRAGRPLTFNSARSYCSYVAGIGHALDIDLPGMALHRSNVAGIEAELRRAQPRIGRSTKIIGDWVSGLRAFADFRAEPSEGADGAV